MPINEGLANLSHYAFVITVMAYALAVLAFACDFAFGRHAIGPLKPAKEQAADLVAVGSAPLAADPGTPGRPPGADGRSPGPGATAPATPPAGPGAEPDAGGMGRWVQVAVGLMIKYRPYYLGLFVMAPIVIIIGLAQTVIYTPAGPIAVALNSYWLAIHVTAITLASGTYVVAAVLAVVFLFADRHSRRVAAGLPVRNGEVFRLLPSPERIDQLAYRTVVFAFPLWTFGIMAGAIWADQAWGRYWGWDPTETWAFITWVVYACFLHARVTAGWRGRRAAYIQLAGFGCLLFNLLGVSIFVTGLHSYAGLN